MSETSPHGGEVDAPFDVELFNQSPLVVAPYLLGSTLSRDSDEGRVSVRITEVEAYLGVGEDPGAHAHRGKTRRNATLFGPPAHLYVYFTYGMHHCANVVCQPDGTASGLLLRGAEVVEGVELARLRRGPRVTDRNLARGPGCLTVAMGIDLAENGSDLRLSPFILQVDGEPSAYLAGPRTGINGPGGTEEYLFRFWIPNEPTVSAYKRHPRLPRPTA